MSDKGSHLIPCHEAVRRLWDYLDGATSPVDHAEVENHLAFCRRCCGELEFVEHLRTLLAAQSTEENPAPAVERLERFVEEL
jgi:anti-sigma factor (TIGR02949 family)